MHRTLTQMSSDGDNRQRKTCLMRNAPSLACQMFFATRSMRDRWLKLKAHETCKMERKNPIKLTTKKGSLNNKNCSRKEAWRLGGKGKNHVTVAIIMHFASGHEAQQPPERRAPANRPCHGQQTSSKIGTTKTSNSCGTVVLNENLWSVPVAVGILDDRDALRGSRNIVGSPYVGFGRIASRDTVYNICSRFRRDAARTA